MNSTRLQALVILVFAILGVGALCRYIFRAITLGFVPGKLGAIHYAGSTSYAVSIFGMVLGILMGAGLAWMCWRWWREAEQ